MAAAARGHETVLLAGSRRWGPPAPSGLKDLGERADVCLSGLPLVGDLREGVDRLGLKGVAMGRMGDYSITLPEPSRSPSETPLSRIHASTHLPKKAILCIHNI